MSIRFCGRFIVSTLFLLLIFISGAHAEENLKVPPLPQLPSIPSIRTFGNVNPPDAPTPGEVMPRLANIAGHEVIPVDPRLAGLKWPVDGKVSSGFGPRGKGTRLRMHEGIDIPVPQGTPVLASLPGLVAESRVYNGYGNTIILDHGNGLKTLYAHCFELVVKRGEVVEQGQIIALAGNTGRSTTSHVHFGVMVQGTFNDPIVHLAPKSSSKMVKKPGPRSH